MIALASSTSSCFSSVNAKRKFRSLSLGLVRSWRRRTNSIVSKSSCSLALANWRAINERRQLESSVNATAAIVIKAKTRMIAGIDFGASFQGIEYKYAVTNWPIQRNQLIGLMYFMGQVLKNKSGTGKERIGNETKMTER